MLFSLITYLIYINVNLNSKILIYPYTLTFLWISISCFSKFVSLFLLCILVHLYEFLHSTCKWYLKIFVFLFLTYVTPHDNFSVHECCCQWHYFILCYGSAELECIDRPLSHHFLDILVDCMPQLLLKKMLPWKQGCTYHFELLFSPDISPEVDFTGHIVPYV